MKHPDPVQFDRITVWNADGAIRSGRASAMGRGFGSASGTAGDAACKSPGQDPGFAPRAIGLKTRTLKGRSADLAERLVHAALDRLGGLGRDLLRQRAELFALRRERFELLAGMGAGEL